MEYVISQQKGTILDIDIIYLSHATFPTAV